MCVCVLKLVKLTCVLSKVCNLRRLICQSAAVENFEPCLRVYITFVLTQREAFYSDEKE